MNETQKIKLLSNYMGIVVGIAGCVVIAYSIGWLPLLGVFLLLWGNNIHLNN